MSGVALDKCSLLSIFVESVVWGLFVPMYMITVFLLLQKKSQIAKNAPFLVLASVMFILCTMHVGLSFARVTRAFFGPAHPISYLANITDTIYRFKYGVLFIEIFLADVLIVYRSFILWNKSYVIALGPALMTIATLVTAGGALHAMTSISGTSTTSDNNMRMWIITTYSLSTATKAICLGLTVFRVRQIHKLITSTINRHVVVYTLLVVLVESGGIALVMNLVLLPTFVSGSTAHYLTCDVMSPIAGIAAAVIIAGMTINLSNPISPTAAAQAAWNRQSMPPRSPITPSRGPKSWNDYDDITPPMSPTPPTPPLPTAVGMHQLNKSTGTLNMAIVI